MNFLITWCFLIAQAPQNPAVPIKGIVIDGREKPLAGIEILVSKGFTREGETPILARGKTDAEGRFSVDSPGDQNDPLPYQTIIWAIDRDRGFSGVVRISKAKDASSRIVIGSAVKRTFRLKDSHDRPIPGVKVAPRIVLLNIDDGIHTGAAAVPDEIFDRFARTTDSKGEADFHTIALPKTLGAIGIDSPSTGRQALHLKYREDEPVVTELKIESGGGFAGKVVDETGKPIEGRSISLWSIDGVVFLGPVKTPGGTIRTRADGSFQTPPVLIKGLKYRIMIPNSDGIDGTATAAIESGSRSDEIVKIPDFRLARLRAIEGKVVDRRGAPVVDAEVFQSGDGPERTSTRTRKDGSFRLEGYRPGVAFVFARNDGYRFFGGKFVAGERSALITLDRIDEPRTTAMKTLASPISDQERKALVRRLLDPLLKKMIENRDPKVNVSFAFSALMLIDPFEALETIDRTRTLHPAVVVSLTKRIAKRIARSDLAEAKTIVDSLPAAEDRGDALITLYDALSEERKADRRAILDRAIIEARGSKDAASRAVLLGAIGERLIESGAKDEAKTLIEEGLKIAEILPENVEYSIGVFAIRLANVDYSAAIKLADKVKSRDFRFHAVKNIIVRGIDANPTQAEAMLARIEDPFERSYIAAKACDRVAKTRVDRALEIADRIEDDYYRATARLLIAKAMRPKRQADADSLFNKALSDIDKVMNNDPLAFRRIPALLPFAEAADPRYVPEIFYRSIAIRSADLEPRTIARTTSQVLALFLARYDREIATILLERGLVKREPGSTDQYEPNDSIALPMIDPRRAVETIESLPFPDSLVQVENIPLMLRRETILRLAYPNDEAWDYAWNASSGFAGFLDRDLH